SASVLRMRQARTGVRHPPVATPRGPATRTTRQRSRTKPGASGFPRGGQARLSGTARRTHRVDRHAAAFTYAIWLPAQTAGSAGRPAACIPCPDALPRAPTPAASGAWLHVEALDRGHVRDVNDRSCRNGTLWV